MLRWFWIETRKPLLPTDQQRKLSKLIYIEQITYKNPKKVKLPQEIFQETFQESYRLPQHKKLKKIEYNNSISDPIQFGACFQVKIEIFRYALGTCWFVYSVNRMFSKGACL